MRNVGKVILAHTPLLLMSFIVVGTGFLPIAAHAQNMGKVEKKVLFEKDVELPSKNIRIMVRRLKFPVGFKTPEHTHKGPGVRYILNGKLEIIEGGATSTFGSGEVFLESGLPMTGENVGGEEAEFIAIDLIPAK